MAEFLAHRGHLVTVHTGFSYYPAWRKRAEDQGRWYRRETIAGVALRRNYLYVPSRPTALLRMLHELSFVLSASLSYLFSPRADCTVIVSPPLPLGIPIALIARLKRSKVVFHVQDLQPDAALELGMLPRGALARLLLLAERWTYALAHRVSAISRSMHRRIVEKGVPTEKTLLFRNWANEDEIVPMPRETGFRQAWGLAGKSVVLYSGNLGVKQGLDLLLRAAAELKGREDVAFVICGDGGERPALEALAARDGLANVQFRPLQPVPRLGELLATADVSVIPQREGMAEIVLPSKLMNIMASARPVVAAARADSELAGIIEQAECGIVAAPGDAKAFAAAITRLLDSPAERERMGRQGRRFVEAHLSKHAVLRQFEGELRRLVAGGQHEARAPSMVATASKAQAGGASKPAGDDPADGVPPR
jgi:colanic acid biosynthesis glycosyl transferase WcaI